MQSLNKYFLQIVNFNHRWSKELVIQPSISLCIENSQFEEIQRSQRQIFSIIFIPNSDRRYNLNTIPLVIQYSRRTSTMLFVSTYEHLRLAYQSSTMKTKKKNSTTFICLFISSGHIYIYNNEKKEKRRKKKRLSSTSSLIVDNTFSFSRRRSTQDNY